ncbi:MAG: Zn-dependent hydrolase [Gammaproteobacteria bacterium]|nr:Zn-dependent hydrolase [Gammaproteobacteria bacterium]
MKTQVNGEKLEINIDRLMGRLQTLAGIGGIAGGGVCRLALSNEDRLGRDRVSGWMRELGLQVSIDRIGNVLGLRSGTGAGQVVLTGSHIDTVATGGRYDGTLGVLAGLEVIATLNDAGIRTRKPLGVGFFTNEEGARFAPDMMGSGVHQGALDLETMLEVEGIDGRKVGDTLREIGYAGSAPVGTFRADSYIELHVEQGPVLEQAGVIIGAVEGVQGISWTEYRLSGTSNHAGTTPMALRQDAGYVAAAVGVEARKLALEMGGSQVATVGVLELKPNLVNVVANEALLTVDLRNTDEEKLQAAEARIKEAIDRIAAQEGVGVSSRRLARFEPVAFDPQVISLVESTARRLGYPVRRLPSGAGHDAQMFAPNCPTGMIFVPSQGGISHNIAEFTRVEDIKAGADVLLQTLVNRAQ